MMRTALIVAGVAAGLLILAGIVRWIFGKKEQSQLYQYAECVSCGWHGQVSRYAGRCPQCNQPAGEQKAQRRG
jgi:predicted Zn-ribbon and HTH transcriptional regulator